MNIYIFNPENDLALANGSPNYEAPLSARLFRSDLALFPIWYADENSVVLTDSPISETWLADERKALNINATWIDLSSFREARREDDVFIPWGWSPAIRKLGHKIGFSELVQSESDYTQYQKISHRAFGIEVLQMLRDQSLLPEELHVSTQLFSSEEVRNFCEKEFPVILKAPWSGSGRGLYWVNSLSDKKLEQWIRPILQKQKSILGEKILSKTKDFAMQFFSDGKNVSFCGYSMFTTDKYGAYKGNSLYATNSIESDLSQYTSIEYLKQVQEALSAFFSAHIAPFYKGYFGVDMMVCLSENNPDTYFIHPCVEINLRMNMGMACRLFYDKYVSPGSQGSFHIDYSTDSNLLYEDHLQRTEKQPLKIENGKICSGYLSLAPVGLNTHYRARVEVCEKG